jgi:hypothetical protein
VICEHEFRSQYRYDLLRGAFVVTDGLEPTGRRPQLAGYDLVLPCSFYDCLTDH